MLGNSKMLDGFRKWRLRARSRFYIFMNWWTGELIAVLPPRYTRRFSRSEKRLVIEMDGPRAAIWDCEQSGEIRALAVVDLEEDEAKAKQQIRAFSSISHHVKSVVARFESRHALQKTLTLPLATEERLRDVVGFEMDRETPFKIDQVYFGYQVTGRNLSTETIDVAITVMPRLVADQAIAKFSHLGIKPAEIEVVDHFDGSGGSENAMTLPLYPNERRTRRRRKTAVINRRLGFASLALLIVASVVPLLEGRQAIDDLNAQMSEVRTLAMETRKVRDEIDQFIERSVLFFNKRGSEPTVAVLLKEMTRLVPDDTWLRQFEIHGDQVKIQGESDNASKLIGLLERSRLFRDTSFISPVTRNPNTNRDRFLIMTKIQAQEGQT